MSKTVREITEDYLKANGYDGLCHPTITCGCKVGDLMPCNEPSPDCIPGYESEDEDGDFIIKEAIDETED